MIAATDRDPWPAGTRIRLARPDRDAIRGLSPHPYTGCAGVVLRSRWFEPVYKLRRGVITDAAPEMVEPGVWLVKVRLEPGPGVEPRWRDGTEWYAFDRELERT
jgi:hypothetical protein